MLKLSLNKYLNLNNKLYEIKKKTEFCKHTLFTEQ